MVRPDDQSYHATDNRWGWVGGVGLEYKLGCNWSLGAEFLSLNFKEHQTKVNGLLRRGDDTPLPLAFRFGSTDTVYVGRILLNYRLGDLLGCCCR